MTDNRSRQRRPAAARVVTPELVRQALASVSPEVDRETWVRLAMAIKSELGDGGFDIWNEWSASAEGYRPTDARDTWRSVKAGGRVTIGTLFGMAKQHGFRFPESGTGAAVDDEAQRAEHERLRLDREKRRAAEEARYRERADAAARTARQLWDDASPEGASAYLQRKGVRAHGVRFLADGTLLVPMRDAAGELQNLQRIASEKPAGDAPDKRFLPGGRKSGLWHWIGEPADAAVVLMAEGYATGASLHEATGLPVAVAFDAGNLVKVAASVRECLPGAAVLVCGDDDTQTAERTGKNPGREKAAAAVKAAGRGGAAAAVFPAPLPAAGSDFNDLAQAEGEAAVRQLVEAALFDLLARHPHDSEEDAAAPFNEGQAGDGAGDTSQRREAAGEAAGGRREDEVSSDPFWLDERGVWHRPLDSDKRPSWVCAPLKVTARTRADDLNGWGYLLELSDPDGNPKSWSMPSSMLAGDGVEWAGRLRDMGLQIAPGPRPRGLLAQYIETRNPKERVTCVDRVGWHGSRVFVLPGGNVGEAEGHRYVFQSEGGVESGFRQAGSLADWQRRVSLPCADNSRLAFGICCALAGPLLRPAGMQGGAFHYVAASSQGKTTALRVAVSVWGGPSFMQQWRSSDNGLEGVALQHSETLLALDEVGQLDPRLIGDAAYMLANGREKVRARAGGGIRRVRTWLALVLSSGEKSMGELMGEVGKRVMAGQEVRFVDVPLDAGQGMGGLEALHGAASPGAFIASITNAAARCHGTAGMAWLDWLTEHASSLPTKARELVQQYSAALIPAHASEQVRRVGGRFALLAAAGELATGAGVTGWQEGQALTAVRACFDAWIAARGHAGNGEEAAALRQVRAYMERNGEAMFTPTWRAMDDRNPKTLNRAGFRRLVDETGRPIKFDAAADFMDKLSTAESSEKAHGLFEYYVLPEAFKSEVCKGFDVRFVAGLLAKHGHLEHEADRLTVKPRLPGLGPTRCYHIKPSLFAADF